MPAEALLRVTDWHSVFLLLAALTFAARARFPGRAGARRAALAANPDRLHAQPAADPAQCQFLETGAAG